MFEFLLPLQCFAMKFHVKNVGLTGLTKTTWSHVNLTLYIYIYMYIYIYIERERERERKVQMWTHISLWTWGPLKSRRVAIWNARLRFYSDWIKLYSDWIKLLFSLNKAGSREKSRILDATWRNFCDPHIHNERWVHIWTSPYIYIYIERGSCQNRIYLKEYENESQPLIQSIKAALTGPPP